jgi:hypothetical protein
MAKSKKQTAAVDLETRRKECGASADDLAAAPAGLTDLDGQNKSGFGTFVEGVVTHPEWSQWPPAKLELSDEEDARIWQKVIARSPRKVKERQDQIQRLQTAVDQLQRKVRGPVAGKKRKEAQLKAYIRAVKLKAKRVLSHAEIASSVDRLLGLQKKNLPSVCPPDWQKHAPRLFAEIFKIPNHPLLKSAKSYISRTKA